MSCKGSVRSNVKGRTLVEVEKEQWLSKREDEMCSTFEVAQS